MTCVLSLALSQCHSKLNDLTGSHHTPHKLHGGMHTRGNVPLHASLAEPVQGCNESGHIAAVFSPGPAHTGGETLRPPACSVRAHTIAEGCLAASQRASWCAAACSGCLSAAACACPSRVVQAARESSCSGSLTPASRSSFQASWKLMPPLSHSTHSASRARALLPAVPPDKRLCSQHRMLSQCAGSLRQAVLRVKRCRPIIYNQFDNITTSS